MKKINAISWLRFIAVIMIVYDHLVAMRNPNWIVNKAISKMICTPLDIIQNFGAFGVALFLIISGFLMVVVNENENGIEKKICKKILKIYLLTVCAFMGFAIVQFITNLFVPTYWRQFTINEWIYSATLVGYFVGNGDVINGTTWFLIPLFFFYCVSILLLRNKNKEFKVALLNTEVLICILGICLWLLEKKGIVFFISQYLPFIFIPITGAILGGIYINKLRIWDAVCILIGNYFLLVLSMHEFNIGYYEQSPYIVSYIYAVTLFVICILGEEYFKENFMVNFINKIGLSIYLLHMTWGSFFMSCLENKLPYIVACAISVGGVVLLAMFYTTIIERGMIDKFLNRQWHK